MAYKYIQYLEIGSILIFPNVRLASSDARLWIYARPQSSNKRKPKKYMYIVQGTGFSYPGDLSCVLTDFYVCIFSTSSFPEKYNVSLSWQLLFLVDKEKDKEASLAQKVDLFFFRKLGTLLDKNDGYVICTRKEFNCICHPLLLVDFSHPDVPPGKTKFLLVSRPSQKRLSGYWDCMFFLLLFF